MNKKGFTLIEVLVVIVIISLLTVVAIPASQGVNKKIKEKLYTSKLTLAEQGAALWGEDHEKCFTCSGASCSNDCKELICHTEYENEKICEIKFSVLADNKYFKYDNEVKKLIEDPRDKNKTLNEQIVTIIYNKKSRTINTNLGST